MKPEIKVMPKPDVSPWSDTDRLNFLASGGCVWQEITDGREFWLSAMDALTDIRSVGRDIREAIDLMLTFMQDNKKNAN